jgi:hypothetical protein
MTGREQGAPKPIRHALGTVTSAEGTRLSSSNRPDQAAKYGREQGVQVEARTLGDEHAGMTVATRTGAAVVVQTVTHHAQAVIVWSPFHDVPLVIPNGDLVTLTGGGVS